MLDRLAWSPTGSLAGADRDVSPEAARGPVEQLLARRLLQPLNAETVILPREVAWQVRGAAGSPATGQPRSRRRSRAGPVETGADRPGGGRGGVRDWSTISKRWGTSWRTDPTGCCATADWANATSPQLAREVDGDAAHAELPAGVRGRHRVGAGARTDTCCPPASSTPGSVARPSSAGCWWPAPGWTRIGSSAAPPNRTAIRSDQKPTLPYAATLRRLVIELLLETGTGVGARARRSRRRGAVAPTTTGSGAAAPGAGHRVDPARGGLARVDRPGGHVLVDHGLLAGGSAGPGVARRPVPGAGRDDHRPGRSHRGGRRPVASSTGRRTATPRRSGIARWRRGLSVQQRFVAAWIRRGLVGFSDPGLAGAALDHRHPATAGVPDRRRRPTPRQHPGRGRRVLSDRGGSRCGSWLCSPTRQRRYSDCVR